MASRRSVSGPSACALAGALTLARLVAAEPARADDDTAFLKGIRHFTTLGSTVPENGDQNPYAIVVAPVSAGKIRKDDVLVDNFNDRNNLQGLGTTIVDYHPATKQLSLFAALPRHLPQCPSGVGLTTAMTMLKSGFVIVGSLPSKDGTTAIKGQGCLLVLEAQGNLVRTITSPNIDGPWGNMVVVDDGSTATLFVSNTGIGVGAAGQDVVYKANVIRVELSIPEGHPPVVTRETVIASGFGEQADKGVFIIGPTGLALGKNEVLYVSDAIGNRIATIPEALTRTTSVDTGEDLTKDGLLQRPLALAVAPNGHLLACNALNGQVVEINPVTGKQLAAQWVDVHKAQTPPGSGDLFGIAMTPEGDGFYYVEDDVNTIVLAH